MPRRAALLTTVLLFAGGAGLVFSGLPPRAPTRAARADEAPGVIRFAYHVHTARSDGSGSVDDVAAAAAQAGLQAVIVTDHGDGTAPRLSPAYRHGVLVIDAEEIGTDAGHVVALGLPASPYPLAGTPRTVVDDVLHLGGMPVVAHRVRHNRPCAGGTGMRRWPGSSGSTSTASGATTRCSSRRRCSASPYARLRPLPR